jgi:signal transduction histidine kinase
MKYLAICGIIAFISGFPSAVFVFFHKPRQAMKVVWSVYASCISLWGFSIFHLFTTTDESVALFWGRFCNYIALWIPVMLFHFVVVLTNRYAEQKKPLFNWYAVYIIYFIVVAWRPDLYVHSVSPKMVFRFYPDAGKLYYLFPILLFTTITHALIVLYESYAKSSLIRRNQYKYFLFTTAVGILGGTTTYFPVFNIPIYPLGAIGVPLYNLAVIYIIVKHQLMDIRIIIRRSLVYLVLVSVITLFYLIGVYLLERVFRNVLAYQSAMGSAALITVIAVLFVPIKNYIESFVERFIFRASYRQMIEQNDRLRQEVIRSERYRTLSELARGMITQLRNPLTALVGYGYQLPRKIDDPEFRQKFITVFNKELNQINDILQRLSQYSEPQPLQLENINMVELVSRLLEQSKSINPKVSIYKYYREDDIMMMRIDPKKIHRALQAIVSFSFHSMPEGGQLWVGMEFTGDILDLSIKDTGKGMSQEEMMKIFDPTFIVDNSDERYELSVAQNIITQHGGKVIVDSIVEAGTEVIVQLPRVTEVA